MLLQSEIITCAFYSSALTSRVPGTLMTCGISTANCMESMRRCRDQIVYKESAGFRWQLLGREVWELGSRELEGE